MWCFQVNFFRNDQQSTFLSPITPLQSFHYTLFEYAYKNVTWQLKYGLSASQQTHFMNKKKQYIEKQQYEINLFRQYNFQQSVTKVSKRSLKEIISYFCSLVHLRDEKHAQCSRMAYNILERFFDREFPEHKLQVYGSSLLSLITESSDVNVVLQPIHNEKGLFEEIMKRLQEYGFTFQYRMINPDTLELVVDPLYQLKEAHQDTYFQHPISVKIMLNLYQRHNFNIRSSYMMLRFLEEVDKDDSLKILLLVLKKILVDANLFNRYEGGINLYCLFLMMASYITQFKTTPEKQSIGDIFKGMIKFYAEQFNPAETVIYFNTGNQKNSKKEQNPCFIPLRDFKMSIDPLRTIVKVVGSQKEVVADLVLPLYIYDPKQKAMLEYGFQKAPIMFELFRRLNYFLTSQEQVFSINYQSFCSMYRWDPTYAITDQMLDMVIGQFFPLLQDIGSQLYNFGFYGSQQTPPHYS